jgi:hypothetical protein
LFFETGRWRAAWVLAAAAPFVRESGLVLPAAAALVWWKRRSWMTAALWAAAGAPFLLWLFTLRSLPGGVEFRWAGAFHSLQQLAWQSESFSRYPQYRAWLHALDLAVLAAFLCACAASLHGLWTSWSRPARLSPGISAAALAAAAALAICHLEPRHSWDSVFSLGRVFAPVYFGLLMHGIASGRPALAAWCLGPAALRAALPLGHVLWRAAVQSASH